MADALRGDFERLRARGVATTFDASVSGATDSDTDAESGASRLEPPTAAVTLGTARRLRRFLGRR